MLSSAMEPGYRRLSMQKGTRFREIQRMTKGVRRRTAVAEAEEGSFGPLVILAQW